MYTFQTVHQNRHGDFSSNEFLTPVGVQVPVVAPTVSGRSTTTAATHGHQHVRSGTTTTTAAATTTTATSSFDAVGDVR